MKYLLLNTQHKAFGMFDSTCRCIIDPNFDPSTRDMTKWEKPLKSI